LIMGNQTTPLLSPSANPSAIRLVPIVNSEEPTAAIQETTEIVTEVE
jgi:hypothetical protein